MKFPRTGSPALSTEPLVDPRTLSLEDAAADGSSACACHVRKAWSSGGTDETAAPDMDEPIAWTNLKSLQERKPRPSVKMKRIPSSYD